MLNLSKRIPMGTNVRLPRVPTSSEPFPVVPFDTSSLNIQPTTNKLTICFDPGRYDLDRVTRVAMKLVGSRLG